MEAKKFRFLKIVGVGLVEYKAKAEAGGRLYLVVLFLDLKLYFFPYYDHHGLYIV
jgi:hypothetical protein